jgi:NitT/TauT family transport system substrate-binding protein
MRLMSNLAMTGVALALAWGLAEPAGAQAIEKKQITLGVGGKGLLYYLPLTLAERLGTFRSRGST